MRRHEWLFIIMTAALAACGGGETPAESDSATAATGARAAPSSDVAPRLEAAGDTWNALANEWQRFTLAAPTTVRYGVGGTWNELALVAGTYTCGNTLFNDPVPGVVKRCESLQTTAAPPPPPPPTGGTWAFVADEWQTFTLVAAATVRYGAGGTWVERALPAGSASCSNAFFGGDPTPGVVKRCEVRADTPSGSWQFLADEWRSFTLEQAQRVRYGAGVNWTERALSAGAGACNNTFFGVDPAPGLVKRCEFWGPATTAGPLELTLLKSDDYPIFSIRGSANGLVLAYRQRIDAWGMEELLLSEDRGATWRRTGLTSPSGGDVVVSANGKHIVATVLRLVNFIYVRDVLLSSDTGHTWRRVEQADNGSGGGPRSLIAISNDGSFILATVYSSSSPDVHIGVSNDGGATWLVALPMPQAHYPLRIIAASPDLQTIEAVGGPLYSGPGALPPGLYRSKDRGRTWSLPEPIESNWVYTVSNDMRVRFALRGGRLARSTDAGATWGALTDTSITRVVWLSGDGRVALGQRASNQEPVISRDFGVTWQPVVSPLAGHVPVPLFLSADGSTALYGVLYGLYIASP